MNKKKIILILAIFAGAAVYIYTQKKKKKAPAQDSKLLSPSAKAATGTKKYALQRIVNMGYVIPGSQGKPILGVSYQKQFAKDGNI